MASSGLSEVRNTEVRYRAWIAEVTVGGKHAMGKNTSQSIGARRGLGSGRDGRDNPSHLQSMPMGTLLTPTCIAWDNPVSLCLLLTTRELRGGGQGRVNK